MHGFGQRGHQHKHSVGRRYCGGSLTTFRYRYFLHIRSEFLLLESSSETGSLFILAFGILIKPELFLESRSMSHHHKIQILAA